jgi:hypothetical protein
VLPGSLPITSPRHLRKHTRSQGPFAPPVLLGFNALTTLSDSRHGHRYGHRLSRC